MSEQLLIRSARAEDLDQLIGLAAKVGSGMTSMPSDKASWEQKLERSISDFNKKTPDIDGDIYFMVLEDVSNNKIIGSGALYAGIGLKRPFYSYKLSTITSSSEKLDLTIHSRVLNLVNDFSGTTEIGSLFLLPEYRRDGIGKFLSRARFLLLADFPERFNEIVFAEMRGWLDANDDSPFWEGLGRKFFGLSFQKADFISAVDGFQFISDLMPKHPVSVDLLSDEAQQAIGKPHDDTRGAMRILENEGFRYSGYVDIFDAGPTLSVPLNQIKTVAQSEVYQVEEIIESDINSDEYDSFIISNSSIPDFRITRSPIVLKGNDRLIINSRTADALQISVNDPVRVVAERQKVVNNDN